LELEGSARSQTDGVLYGARNYVICKAWGDRYPSSGSSYNHYWLLTDLDSVNSGRDGRSFVSAYFLDGAGNQANDTANYYDGSRWREIPNCGL